MVGEKAQDSMRGMHGTLKGINLAVKKVVHGPVSEDGLHSSYQWGLYTHIRATSY